MICSSKLIPSFSCLFWSNNLIKKGRKKNLLPGGGWADAVYASNPFLCALTPGINEKKERNKNLTLPGEAKSSTVIDS